MEKCGSVSRLIEGNDRTRKLEDSEVAPSLLHHRLPSWFGTGGSSRGVIESSFGVGRW